MKNSSISINCLLFQLGLSRKKVQKWYESFLSNYGLNSSYVYVMEVIKDTGPCSLTSIANYLELERATVSPLLTRMERDGFIKRLPGKERRTMEVHLSEKGKGIIEEALVQLKEADKQLNDKLEGELQTIKSAIEKINNKM
ncbi:DNA-binding MarR family transcriptional regulator [Salirhabdus euzebyi]|uniref:DNA-binding MarR family transcriptional regulator n=1 Tax=Salirhabdus euzebyi TaxID=394506 RepID=A0A841Q4L7_9BACI|nr:MarR family transcriptional regulator [Salirhabdus euzebyi]MBB6453379.1 DNA-binding MarR family transcriptional regulator [Salirhabdus euzebyi]